MHLDCSHAEQGSCRHNASNGKQNPWRRVRLDQRYDDVPAKKAAQSNEGNREGEELHHTILLILSYIFHFLEELTM